MWIKTKQVSLINLVVILFVSCNNKLQPAKEDVILDVVTYRQTEVKEFDFNQEPLVSDINKISSGALDDYIVKDQTITDSIQSKRNYYKLYYYSQVSKKSGLFALLGFYDYYYDIILVSTENGTFVDWALIASTAGDAEDFEQMNSQITSDSTVDITQIKGKREFSKPDSTITTSKVLSRILIRKNGSFHKRIIGSY